jgi:hypothetical protein
MMDSAGAAPLHSAACSVACHALWSFHIRNRQALARKARFTGLARRSRVVTPVVCGR